MSKKKTKKSVVEEPEIKAMEEQKPEQPQQEGIAPEGESLSSEGEKVNELEGKLKKQIDELRDTNLRLHAEFDNYRKRTIREKVELSKMASEEVIVDLLPILDDFERALQNLNKEDDDPFIEGIRLIYNKLTSTLSKKGLEEIQAKGQTFDTDYHEAISHMPVQDETQKNKIIDVTQKGYKLHGKVIRFAKVVVGA